MPSVNRRSFLKASGLSVLPAMLPALPAIASADTGKQNPPNDPVIRFFGDGEMFEPAAYLALLQEHQKEHAIERDRYGDGGAVGTLEEKFREITGKEKAMFMPTGTMANQLAIAVLCGDNTKVFVQDTSHVFRDEADAAQSVFEKRLIPLAKGEAYFTAAGLQQAIEALNHEEVFKSGIGAVSIENPVRRNNGQMVPLEEIKKISEYCRANGIRLHLDGARIYMASAWSGTGIKEYASYFDTIYISLYKYLGAAGGAILCGDKKIMDKMGHLVKIHGGAMYSNWANAAMALHRLEGIEDRLKEARKRSEEIFAGLNKMGGIRIDALPGGTNIYNVEFGKNIDGKKVQQVLNKEHNIRMAPPDANNKSQLMVNETLLYREIAYVINAFKQSLKNAQR
jgi:threonine aldolase